MSKTSTRSMAVALCAGLLAAVSPARAQNDDALGFERTPPRLSFTDGEVSFLRPGADDWTPARVNTALAAGDELYTAQSANLELQVGARAFVRAGENTQLGLTSLEPDFLQLRMTAGHASLDLRSLKAGQTIELDTPNAAFSVERSGYYRIEVDGDTTTFTSRRGGRATVTPASGDSATIAASEQVVVSGTDAPQVESYAAPELDAWDRWNYSRTDDQLDAVSARYVPSGVYGANDLDHYGDWRVVPSYGAVWVPRHVAVGWAPYSTGRWVYDPYYAWTWVDDAPWGWAPYHYGRWARISGYWGWCPGPIVARPYYAPALVAFYGGGGFSVGVTIGTPHVGWVALGWGEPILPWWGSAHHRGNPHWAGWGGPRVVNKIVVKNKTVIKANEINFYQNANERDAIVGVDRDHFGRRSAKDERFTRLRPDKLKPMHGDFDVKPNRSSLVAEDKSAQRPPREAWKRSVVATREPREDATPALEKRRAPKTKSQGNAAAGAESGAPDATPPPRVVQPPREGNRIETSKRPRFGTQSEGERRMPPPAPRFEKPARDEATTPRAERTRAEPPERSRAAEPGTPAPSQADRQKQTRSQREASPPPRPELRSERVETGKPDRPERVEAPKPDRTGGSSRREQASPPPRDLPGEPANRVYRQRDGRQGSIIHENERTARAQPSEKSRDAGAKPSEKSRDARAQSDGRGDSGSKERGGSHQK